MIALEPVMTAFLAWLILSESITRLDLLSFGLASLGFGILAGVHPLDLWRSAQEGGSLNGHLLGNLLIALSLFGEAVFTIISKKLIQNYAPLAIFGSALAVGVVCMGFAVAGITLWDGLTNQVVSGSTDYFFHWSGWGWKVLLAGFWIGPLGTTAGYLIYMLALADVSVVVAVLFLFLQPLVGALLGYLFLAERLDRLQCFGGFLILLAVLLVNALPNALRLRNRTAY
jgi:drug/metabolite transporter (DMT)-like permease